MSGFREPLDVSGYIANLGDGRALGGTLKKSPSVIHAPEPEPLDVSRPYQVGLGPPDASTCTDLVPWPQIIWDVNGYYRRFGFTAPYQGITRKELRLAYLTIEGQNSVYLTRIFRNLIDEDYRREYNSAPLGELYMDDIQQELLKERALRKAAAMASRNTSMGIDRNKLAEKLLDDWGLQLNDDDDDHLVPEPASQWEDHPDMLHGIVPPWPWGYFVWSSPCRDSAKLSVWQEMLVREFVDRGALLRFGVGYFGRRRSDSEWVTGVSGSHLVIFLREDIEPTQERAASAAAQVLIEHTGEVTKGSAHG